MTLALDREELTVLDRIANRYRNGTYWTRPTRSDHHSDTPRGVIAHLSWQDGAWILEVETENAYGMETRTHYDVLEIVENTKRLAARDARGRIPAAAFRLGTDTEDKLLATTSKLLRDLGYPIHRSRWENLPQQEDEYGLPITAVWPAIKADGHADSGDIYEGNQATGWRKFKRGEYSAWLTNESEL